MEIRCIGMHVYVCTYLDVYICTVYACVYVCTYMKLNCALIVTGHDVNWVITCSG